MAVSRGVFTWTLLILTVILVRGEKVNAQSAPAPGPGVALSECMILMDNMSRCWAYLQEDNVVMKPNKGCCAELANMLDTNPNCLCLLLGKTDYTYILVDVSRTLQAPSLCGLKTPHLTSCSVAMPPESEVPLPGKNGVSSAHISLAYLIAGLALALALTN